MTATEFDTTDLPNSRGPLGRLERAERKLVIGSDRAWGPPSSVGRSVRLRVDADGLRNSVAVRTPIASAKDGDGIEDRGSLSNQTVTLAGPLDLGTSANALNRLIEAVETGDGRLVVDLDRVSSITTTGVLVLDAAERHARSVDREMFVSCVRSDVCEAIRAVGMERLLRSH